MSNIDLDAIKAKLQQMQQSSASGGSKAEHFWKPPVGKSVIRIVPYAFNKNYPFIELYHHYEVSKRTLVSPISFGRPDPIVEFVSKLKRTGDKMDFKMARKIEPKLRIYAPVIVRGFEHEGVKFWSFGKQIYTELLGIMADPDYGDITDLNNGRDITLEHIAAEKEGAFASFTVRPKPNMSPATDKKEVADMILNGQKNLVDLYTEPSYEELNKIMQEYLSPSQATEGQVTSTSSPKELQASFDDLFNKA